MNPDQQIRAAAAQAASGMVPRGVDLVDYLMACDVTAAFIETGWDAAFAAYKRYGDGPSAPEATPQRTGPQPATLVEPMMPPVTPPPVAAASSPPESKPGTDENVIPLGASRAVPPQQSKAMHLVDKAYKEAARSILGQASVAKVKAHMENLMTQAQDRGLWDFPVTTPEGEVITLGKRLEVLYAAKGFDRDLGAKA